MVNKGRGVDGMANESRGGGMKDEDESGGNQERR